MPQTSSGLYAIGNVTDAFRSETISEDMKAVLDQCIIERISVSSEIVPTDPIWELIGEPPRTAETYRITFDGKQLQFKATYCAMPRDVWNVLKGISLATRNAND